MTPVVLDRFPKSNRNDPKQRQLWEHEVGQIISDACSRIGLPEPSQIDLGTTSWVVGCPRAIGKRRPLRGKAESEVDHGAPMGDGFPPYALKGTNAPRPQVHVWIQFRRPVVGPIILGAGRLHGLRPLQALTERQSMTSLSADQFKNYFRELHGHDPYSWQSRLASRAIEGNWPRAIDLPTGSGKTACIDIAVYALACQATRDLSQRAAPRRIFFCVNRRVIVDEAYQRAHGIAEKLSLAEQGSSRNSPVLEMVAAALREVAGTSGRDDSPPLDVLELRGGIYRDNSWARSAAHPTVVCTTIDQLGSRLLFRGYGVSPSAAPIQAALLAYDSVVFLDEAHIQPTFPPVARGRASPS